MVCLTDWGMFTKRAKYPHVASNVFDSGRFLGLNYTMSIGGNGLVTFSLLGEIFKPVSE